MLGGEVRFERLMDVLRLLSRVLGNELKDTSPVILVSIPLRG